MRHLLFSAFFVLCLLVCFGPLAWAAGQPPPMDMVLSRGIITVKDEVTPRPKGA